MISDLKYALRTLAKTPGFTIIAVFTLALAIGANTAIFSLINDLFLRGLPFKQPSRVVHLFGGDKSRDLVDIGVSAPRYQHFRDGQTVFDGLAAENFFLFTLTGLGDPVQVFGGRLTSNYFDLLAVRPILGRNFLPQEEEGADVAVVTKNFWQKRLGGDPNVIGRSITLDGTLHTIVGVLPNMPAAWFGANPVAEVWTTKPFQLPGFSHEQLMRGSFFLRVVGRLKPGVTVQQARAALPSLEESYRVQYPNNIDSALVPRMASIFLSLETGTATSLSIPVLLFAIGLSILTGLLMGIYPALQGSHADLVDALKEGGRGTSGSVRQQRFRKILVGAQVALSVTLLVGAALLITSFIRLTQQNIGFRSQNLWTGAITLPTSQYPDRPARQRFVEQTLRELRSVPGLESATISGDIPLVGFSRYLYARGYRDVPPVEKREIVPGHEVTPGYFKTWGVPLLAGRDFNEHDTADGQKVCLIIQAVAKQVFPGENPIGKTLFLALAQWEIVGIVGDVRSVQVAEPPGMEFYRPWAQYNFPFVNITVRTNLKVDAVTRLVQSALTKVNPSLAIAVPQTMDAVVARAIGQARLMMWVLGIFAGVALLLASIGIYGAVAYTVEQRTGEIGVRMALGAQTRDVLRLVVNQGMKPVLIGLGIGIGSAFAVGRLIASQLYQVSAHNPALLVGSTLLLATIALIACLLPARRATRVDPIQALRTE